jgi:hypothetical protein
MNSQAQRSSRDADQMHARARRLSNEAIDFPLDSKDAAWLAGHLNGCQACQSVADEYRSLHAELGALPLPIPPRDLWARTSAALDGVERTAAARANRPLAFGRPGGLRYVGVGVAAALVVAVAGFSVLSRLPSGSSPTGSPSAALAVVSPAPSSSQEMPFAVVDGKAVWIASASGVYQIKDSSAKCAPSSSKCTVSNGTGTVLGTIASATSISAVVAPDARQAAVWTSDKIVLLPLNQAASAPVAIDMLTPRPTVQATQTLVATATPTASVSALPSSSLTPSAPTATPASTSTVRATPGSVTQPTAILDGFEIVGRNPEFSADGSWVAFAARPIDHSTGPDVFVWHAGDEVAQAVTSAHADVFSGWFGKQILISEYAATTSPAPTAGPSDGSAESPSESLIAPNAGSTSGFTTVSFIFDPASRTAQRIERSMFMPAVDPTGRYLIYWHGVAGIDPVTRAWRPSSGDLYFDSWADLGLAPAWLGGPASGPAPVPSAVPTDTPAATDTDSPSAAPGDTASPTDTPTVDASATPQPVVALPQLLPVGTGRGTVTTWIVRWDSTGQHVAIWVADKTDGSVGELKLFSIDPLSGLVDVNRELVAVRALPNIGFDGTNLIYTAAADGKTYIVPAAQATPSPTPVATTPAPTATATPS